MEGYVRHAWNFKEMTARHISHMTSDVCSTVPLIETISPQKEQLSGFLFLKKHAKKTYKWAKMFGSNLSEFEILERKSSILDLQQLKLSHYGETVLN